jgi:hypothetical protein
VVLKVGADRADEQDMSDLSRLLDDVYRTTPPAPAPAWSPETAALDEVFSNWIPGPPATPAESPEIEVVDEVEVRPEPELRTPRTQRGGLVWSIADDDILPARRTRGRFRLRRR